MNPSNFPQVIRSRSRSPSPVFRHRVHSDVHPVSRREGKPTPANGVDSAVLGESGGHSPRPSLLTVTQPVEAIVTRTRSCTADDVQQLRTNSLFPGGVAELEDMANMGLNNLNNMGINNDDLEQQQCPDNQEDGSDPDAEPTIVCRRHWATSNPTRPADISPRSGNDACIRKDKDQKSYGGVGDNCGCWTPDQVDQLRRRVKFYFMDPYSKFKARRHIPWKMFLQVLKIIIITVQLVRFGNQRSEVVEYFECNQRTLQNLLLLNWDPSYETMPYPPATGVYALYSVDEFLAHIQNAWSQYYSLSESSLASIHLIKDRTNEPLPVRLCYRYDNYHELANGSYVVGRGALKNCTDLIPLNATGGQNPYDIRKFQEKHNFTIPFPKLLDLTLDFSFNTFHLNMISSHYGPTCYKAHTTIRYSNYERSGQVLITLGTERVEQPCSGKILTAAAKKEENDMRTKSIVLDAVVIVICSLSTILCSRSLLRGWKLKRKTVKLFKHKFGKDLKLGDRMEFISFWYFLIIVNDVFTIIGSAYKIQLEARTVTITSNTYDICSLLLGLGTLMAWIGCLRYLSFFRKYNILILTLKVAFPNVLRFMVCVLAMYLGFMFCGWLVLGPYHIKFRHLSTASECLYSLVNGDDMFVTFSALETNNVVVWYFSRIYLYVFISLFIYCVLSLFISVIMDTYETIKDCHEKGFPKTDLHMFIEECNAPLKSGLYSRQHTENEGRDWSLIGCLSACCRKRHKPVSSTPSERAHLLTQTI